MKRIGLFVLLAGVAGCAIRIRLRRGSPKERPSRNGPGPTCTRGTSRVVPDGRDPARLLLERVQALAVYGVLRSNFPPDLYVVRVRFFYRSRYQLGGRFLSLYALENQIIRPIGDPRVHVALNCRARGCPRLPREPFRPEELDAQLDREARRFYNEERNVRPEPETKTVHLSEILRFYTRDFLRKAPSSIDYVNRYRREKIPPDWKIAFVPYDWRLNSQ